MLLRLSQEVGNSREKAPDLWEVLNSTSTSCQDQSRRRDPSARANRICQPHALTPMVRCWVTAADIRSPCGALADTT